MCRRRAMETRRGEEEVRECLELHGEGDDEQEENVTFSENDGSRCSIGRPSTFVANLGGRGGPCSSTTTRRLWAHAGLTRLVEGGLFQQNVDVTDRVGTRDTESRYNNSLALDSGQ